MDQARCGEHLLAGGLSIRWAIHSEPGARATNEDRAEALIEADTAIFVVADGLGGQGAGDEAAQAVMDALKAGVAHAAAADASSASAASPTSPPPPLANGSPVGPARAPATDLRSLLGRLLDQAHGAVLALQRRGVGTRHADATLVLLAVRAGEIAWANLGDSRLYRCDATATALLSRDHSLASLLIETGSLPDGGEVRGNPDRNRLVRTMASTPRPSDIQGPISLQAGTGFLLCTDGWWEPVSDPSIGVAHADAESPEGWLSTMASAVRAAGDPDQDNYTAVAIMTTHQSLRAEP